MNPEIKAKWVAALRSGEYKQGHTYLRNRDNKFCCLGVLCDIIDPTLWTQEQKFETSFSYLGRLAELPGSLQEEFELGNMGTHPNLDQSLASMNDGGCSFEEIADIIEKHL
jgi:hypothetical protein